MGFVFCSGSKTLFVKVCAPSRKASQLHGWATHFVSPGNSYLELDALSSLSSQSSQCVLIKTPGLPVCTRACTSCSFEGGAVCSCRLSAITPKWSKICAHPCSSRGLMHPPACGRLWRELDRCTALLCSELVPWRPRCGQVAIAPRAGNYPAALNPVALFPTIAWNVHVLLLLWVLGQVLCLPVWIMMNRNPYQFKKYFLSILVLKSLLGTSQHIKVLWFCSYCRLNSVHSWPPPALCGCSDSTKSQHCLVCILIPWWEKSDTEIVLPPAIT